MLGVAGVTSGIPVLLSTVLPANNIPTYIGGMGIVYGCGAVLGPIIGGALAGNLEDFLALVIMSLDLLL
jgi:MFS family permease